MQNVNNKYCVNLNLKFPVDNDFFERITITDIPYYGFKQIKIDESLLDIKLIEFLAQRGIKVHHAEAFYTLPGNKIPIHIDTEVIGNQCKLNFVYGDPGSKMQWWRLKDENMPLKYRLTPIGTKYLMFSPKDCEMVWEAEVGNPSMVNAGQPHSVNNCTSSPRKTLSLMLYNINKKQLLDWDDGVEIFKDFIQ
jgi:hypothetical protein